MSKVFTNLREYVGVHKLGENATHYLCECINCIDERGSHKPHLYIKKDYKIGWCFGCNTTFINKVEIKNLSDYYDQVTPLNNRVTPYKSKYFNPVGIDCTYYLESNELNKESLDYLHGSHRLPVMDPSRYLIKSRKGKVVIPFYYYDKLIYYQIRFINPIGPKYFNPIISNKPLYLLPNRSYDKKKLVLVEGVFDAIACDYIFDENYMIAGVLGSTLTNYQLSMIKQFNIEEIVIFLDKTELSLKLRNKLRGFGNYKFSIINSDGMDPEEYVRSKVAK